MQRSTVVIAGLLILVSFLIGIIGSGRIEAQSNGNTLVGLLGHLKAVAEKNIQHLDITITIIGADDKPSTLFLAHGDSKLFDAKIVEIGDGYTCLQTTPVPGYEAIVTCLPFSRLQNVSWGNVQDPRLK